MNQAMSSENPIIEDASQMITLIKQALAGSAPGADFNEFDDELLTVLAEGRIDTLSLTQRNDLLSRIAAVPEAAELLARLRDVGLGQSQPKPTQTKTLQWTRVCWALAACLMIGLFVSTWVAPTPHVTTPQGQITPYQTPGQPDYWGQADQQRLQQQQTHWTQYRDIALIVSTGTCLVLSMGLVIALRRRKFGS